MVYEATRVSAVLGPDQTPASSYTWYYPAADNSAVTSLSVACIFHEIEEEFIMELIAIYTCIFITWLKLAGTARYPRAKWLNVIYLQIIQTPNRTPLILVYGTWKYNCKPLLYYTGR